MKAAMPKVFELLGSAAYPLLKLGGVPVDHVEGAAAQCGLKEDDVIVGYALDANVTDGGRGVLALSNGQVKWQLLQSKRASEANKVLKTFDKAGSVTLTVLRALPLKIIPSDHGLSLAFMPPPSLFRYEPNVVTCIAGNVLAELHPDIRPSQGQPYVFSAACKLPAGVELTANGIVKGSPSDAAASVIVVKATNAKGSIEAEIKLKVVRAPTELLYGQGHMLQYALNTQVAANTVSKIDGDGPFRFFSEPPLPPGLTLDADTGAISGSPREVRVESCCVITATSAAGSVSASLIISVAAPPSLLRYSSAHLLLPRSIRIQDMQVAQLEGTAPFTFSCSPTLPSGLSIDPNTGSVVGTPATELEETVYCITASNVAGSAGFEMKIHVLESPSGFEYQQGRRGAKLSYTVGAEIVENYVASLTGSRPMTFSCNTSLPPGLSVDHATGALRGTPTGEQAASMFEMVVMNAAGIATCPLNIEVLSPDEGLPGDGPASFPSDEEGVQVEELVASESALHSFLRKVQCEDRLPDFIREGWDTLEMVYAMTEADLREMGLTAEEAVRVLAGQPSAVKADDRRQMKRFLQAANLQATEPTLLANGVKGMRALSALTLPHFLRMGIPSHLASALAAALQQRTTPPPLAPVLPPPGGGGAPSPPLLKAGIGMKIKQLPPHGVWHVTEILPGGSAARVNCAGVLIAPGDAILAIASNETDNMRVQITPSTRVEDLTNLILGPVNSYLTLTLNRRGTRFDVPVPRQPVAAVATARGAELTLQIRVVNATGLPAMDTSGTSDPYVICSANQQSFTTPVIWKTLNPTWNSGASLRINESSRLVFSVWDKDTFTPDDLIGKMQVQVADVVDFATGAIKQPMLKGRLISSDGAEVLGVSGEKSRIFIAFTGVRK